MTTKEKPEAPEEQPKPDAIAYPAQLAQMNLEWLRSFTTLPPGKTIGDAADHLVTMANAGKPVTMPKG